VSKAKKDNVDEAVSKYDGESRHSTHSCAVVILTDE